MEQTKRRIPIIAFLLSIVLPGLGHALSGVILQQTFPFDLHELLPVRTFRMPTSSMAPALEKGDYLIAGMKPYADSAAKRGDVVIFPYPEDTSKLYIKRIIGLPGERIQIKDKVVFINDQRPDDPWGVHKDKLTIPVNDEFGRRDNFGPVDIPEGEVFVLGDNRDFSQDSRFFGNIRIKEIRGKPLFIYWSDEWNRIGKQIK